MLKVGVKLYDSTDDEHYLIVEIKDVFVSLAVYDRAGFLFPDLKVQYKQTVSRYEVIDNFPFEVENE
jgi:hypothetical protein